MPGWRHVVPDSLESAAFGSLCLSAFAMAFSLPAGRALLAIALLLWLINVFRSRQRVAIPIVAWIGFLFVLEAAIVTVFGVNPELGVPKLRKLLWFVGIPVWAAMVGSPGRLGDVMRAFALGSTVLSLRICGERLGESVCMALDGRRNGVVAFLVDAGSMTYSQMLMGGIVVTLGLVWLAKGRSRQCGGWAVALGLQVFALAIMFKRGTWISTAAVVAVFLAIRTNWKTVLALSVVAVVCALTLSPVRSRLAGLTKELQAGGGGRLTMWTEVAPALVRAHPWGTGYRSLTNRMMREIAREVEPNRDHLHSNPVDILVSTGWLGLVLYVAWMGCGLRDSARFRRAAESGPPELDAHALSLLLVLSGLLLNGLVEYNFGDSELVLLYGLVLGCASAGRRITECSCDKNRGRSAVPVP